MSLSFLQKSNTNIIPTNQGSKTNYLAKKFGLGALGTLEGITDFVSISLAKLQGKDDLAKRLAGNNITGTLTQEIDTAFNPSGAMKVAGDISSGIGQGVTYIGAGILTGGSALGGAVVGGVSAAGGALSGAYQKTGQVGGKEFGYATLVGATEGILKGVLSPVAGKIATRLTTSVGKSTAKGIIKTVAKEGASEFLEEAIAEYANPFYEKWSGVDKNAQTSLSAPSEQFEGKTRLADILYAGALGFASGGILSGTSMVINNTRAVAVGNKIVKNNSANGLIESATAMQEYNLTNKVQVEDKAVSAFNKKLDKQNKELYDGLSRSLEQYNKQKNKESTIAKMYLGNMAGAISYIARNNGVMESYTEVVENADIYRDYINKKGVEYTSQDIIENKDGVAEQLAILHFTGKMFAEQGIDGVTTTDKASLSDSQIAIARDNATDEQASKFKADYGIGLKTASTSEIRNVLGDFNKSIPANASELTLKDGVAKFDTGKHLITVKPNGDKYDLTAVSKSGKTKTITVTESQLNEFLQANQKQAVETTQGIDSAEVESLGKEWVAGYSELSLNKRTRINEAIRSGKQFNISDNVLKGTCYIIANRNNLSIEFSDKITQNGVWHKDGKNTYAVINANMEADTIRHTVIHETFHDLNTRKDFKELVNEAYAKSLENNKAEVDERTAQYKEQFPDMTEQAIKEEIAADYFGKELSGEETFSETFSYKYKSLWQRVKLHITNLASKLRGKDSYTHSEVSEVGELFDSLIKSDNAITLKDGVKYSLDDFSKQVDQVINGTFDKENSHILVRNNTPKIFIETAGMKNLPIIISFDKLSIAMFNNGKLSNHYHNLGAATIKQIPTALESPLYIFESTNPKRIEAVIQLKDYKGRDIFTVIEFDGSGRVNGKFITANILVTAFGAQTKYIQDRVNNSKILYEAIKIGSTPQVNPRGQFPSVINESKPNIIISNSTENSNTFEKKSLTNDKKSQNYAKYSLSDSNGKKLTEAQAGFFKDSKARDEQGKLLEVYHGTGTGFNVFDRTKARSYSSVDYDLPAFYFSADKRQARDYGSRVIDAYINLTNPLIAEDQLPNIRDGETPNDLYNRLVKEGYDGIIIPGESILDNEYIVFHSNQIKFTTNLNPTVNEDIRYSLNKYTPKAVASAKALIDSNIITNDINAHFWQWHSEAVAELIDKEIALPDKRTVRERVNSIAGKIMQEGKYSTKLDEKYKRTFNQEQSGVRCERIYILV